MTGQRDDSVQVVVSERLIQAASGQPVRRRPYLDILRICQVTAGRVCFGEQFLAKVSQHCGRVLSIELNEAGQVSRVLAAEAGQVRIDVVLELAAQRGELRLADLVGVGQLDRIRDVCARPAQRCQG